MLQVLRLQGIIGAFEMQSVLIRLFSRLRLRNYVQMTLFRLCVVYDRDLCCCDGFVKNFGNAFPLIESNL